MKLIDELAEQHIRQAIERGELDNLPGAGKPLQLDDDSMVPEELRAGYRLLKNAGYVPPEVESLRAVRDLRALVALASDPGERDREVRRLRLMEARLEEARGRGFAARVMVQYRDRLLYNLGASEVGKEETGTNDDSP